MEEDPTQPDGVCPHCEASAIDHERWCPVRQLEAERDEARAAAEAYRTALRDLLDAIALDLPPTAWRKAVSKASETAGAPRAALSPKDPTDD
jgi:hypothetical protein